MSAVDLPPPPVWRLLVSGGRDFKNHGYVAMILQRLHHKYSFRVLIHGDATGADALADDWARRNGVQPCACAALWNYYESRGMRKAAGAIRNKAMLALQPQLVVGFPGGTGTADMLKAARACEIPTIDLAEHYASRERPQ